MKKLITIFFIAIANIGFGQGYPIQQNIGSGSTLVRVPPDGGFQASLINRNFVDTTAANATNIKYYPGSQIFTTLDTSLWIRNTQTTRWLRLQTSGQIINGDTINYLVDVNRPPGQLNVYGKFFNGISAYSRLLYTDSIGSGGGSSYTFQYPLSETAGVAKIDTNFFWKPYGNSAINPLLNFIGTTDSNSLVFKVNNFHSGLISYAAISPVNGQPASKGTHFGFGAGAYSASLGLESGTYFGNGTGMYAGDSTSANTFIGNKAGLFHTVGGTFGGRNVAVGEYSQFASVRGYDNTSVGVFALNQNFSGFANSAFGRDALKSSLDGNGNSAFGAYSLWHNTSGVVGANIANGGSGYTTATVTLPAPTYPSTGGTCFEQATATAIISGGSIVGITITNPGCGYITSSYGMNKLGFAYTWAVDSNIVITGDGTGAAATVIFGSGEGNSAYGVYSGTYRRLSYYDTYIGYQSGHNSRYRDSLNLFIGYSTDVDASVPLATNIKKSTAIGYNAKVGASKVIVLGATGLDQPKVGIGTINPQYGFHVETSNGVMIDSLLLLSKGLSSGTLPDINSTPYNGQTSTGFGINVLGGTGLFSTAFGYQSQKASDTQHHSTSFGSFALMNNTHYGNSAFGSMNLISNTTGYTNSNFGAYGSPLSTTGTGNQGFGAFNLYKLTTGSYNVVMGRDGGAGITTGWNNTSMGTGSMGYGGFTYPGTAAITGSNNSFVGSLSGFGLTSGSFNGGFGQNSGYALTSGNYNMIFGGNTGSTIATKSNHVIISDGQGNIKSVTDSLGNIVFSGTGAMTIHIGTTAQRPSSPTAGMYRFNSDSLAPEFYSGSAWLKVSQGGVGSGTVTSVATNNGTGITGGTITGSGTLAIDTANTIATRLQLQHRIDSLAATGGGGITVGTTTITSGTNTRVLYNNSGVVGEYTVSGTGNVAMTTSPTFTTNITTPLVIGGTGTTSTLNFKTTSGVGTTGADMKFLVGNNGSTEAMTILNNGNVGIGLSPYNSTRLAVRGQSTSTLNYSLYVENSSSTPGFYVTDASLVVAGRASSPTSQAFKSVGLSYMGGTSDATAIVHIAAGSATASTAPLKFTSGTNLTTAEAGAMEYTTPKLTFTNGGLIRQEIPLIQQSRVSTQYDNATTTLGNVTGLTASVAAGKTYRFEAKLYTTSNVAGGIKTAIAGTATATNIIYEGLTTDAGVTTQSRATALATSVGAVTAVTAAYVLVTGTITVNAAGTITVQAAANAATGTTSVLVGSTFVLTEML